jgi:hypothetical protein
MTRGDRTLPTTTFYDPGLTVGYNTEAQARRSIQAASDQAEAR